MNNQLCVLCKIHFLNRAFRNIVLLLESSSSQSRYYSSVICLHQMLDYCQNFFSENGVFI